jgi:hypothetical protein
MGLLINILIAAVIALVIYFVAVALIGHATIVGLVCLLIFLLIAFAGYQRGGFYNRRSGPPVV